MFHIYDMFLSPRFLLLVIFFSAFIIWLIVKRGERGYSKKYSSVDAVVPAFNEEVTISRTVRDLLENKYIRKVVSIDDGSTDRTSEVLNELQKEFGERLVIVRQSNTGKAGAINKGLTYVETEKVFLTDADIRIPNNDGLGYLIRAVDKGADAVAGIPGSDLSNLNFLGKVRASIKIFFATYRKCGMEVISGHPFCVSGSAGMYKTKVLRNVKFSGRTCVEDLDLTWELISRGYKIGQSSRAIVYSQEASCLKDDLKRWRRWISGYAVCMRIHKNLLFTRFGLTAIVPNFLIGISGAILLFIPFFLDYKSALHGLIIWFVILFFVSYYSAKRQGGKWWLILYSPFSVLIILIVSFCWIVWGIPSLITGREKGWSKIKRY